jgi:hypothetical protein
VILLNIECPVKAGGRLVTNHHTRRMGIRH